MTARLRICCSISRAFRGFRPNISSPEVSRSSRWIVRRFFRLYSCAYANIVNSWNNVTALLNTQRVTRLPWPVWRPRCCVCSGRTGEPAAKQKYLLVLETFKGNIRGKSFDRVIQKLYRGPPLWPGFSRCFKCCYGTSWGHVARGTCPCGCHVSHGDGHQHSKVSELCLSSWLGLQPMAAASMILLATWQTTEQCTGDSGELLMQCTQCTAAMHIMHILDILIFI